MKHPTQFISSISAANESKNEYVINIWCKPIKFLNEFTVLAPSEGYIRLFHNGKHVGLINSMACNAFSG